MKQLQHIFIIIIAALAWSTEAGAWGETTSYVLEKEINGENSGASQYNEDHWQLSGPGAKITLDARKATKITAGGIDIQVSTDGSNWTTVYTCSSLSTSWKSYSYETIATNVTHIRLKGNLAGTRYYRNVRVTRATTLSTSTTSLSFGNVTKGSDKTLNAYVDYNNTTYNQQVTGSCKNERFSVTATTVGATGTGKSIPVIFKPTAVGAQDGTVTLTMNGKTVTFSVSGTGVTTYYGQATAQASAGGSAYVSFTSYDAATSTSATTNTANTTATNASKTAYYKATVNTGYRFLGWIKGTGSYNASNVVSTDLTYNPSITYSSENSDSPTIAAFKAWFAPVFNFSATATPSNATFGTATASVAASVEGNPEQASASTTATYTATPAAGCTFNGWYEAADFSGTPVSTDATYTVTLTNSTPGSTVSKTLYAKFKKNPVLTWTDPELDVNLVNGTTVVSAAHGVDEGLNITYTSSNTDAVTVDPDGTVHAVGLGTSTVTASVAADDTYNADAITRKFSVGDKKQPTFTPVWGDASATDIKVGTTTTIDLINVAADETFSIEASPTGIVSWTRTDNTLTISGDVAGTTELTLSQTGNAFLNGNTTTYTITVSRYENTFALGAETKAMKVGDTWTGVVTNTGNDNTVVTYSAEGVATYDAATNAITATGEGSTTITFTQAATATHEGKTLTIDVTVTKVANTLAISLPAQAAEVDGTIALAITGQNNTDAIMASITDTQLSSTVNDGTEDVITYANGIITAKNAGTAHITFSQPATAKYTAYTSQTYKITVTKRSNAITLTLNEAAATNIKLKYGATATLAYTRTNMDTTPTVIRTSGSYTTLSGSTITAGNAAGTDIYEVSQAETYKYEAAYAQFSIRVNNTDEGTAYVLYEEKEYSHGTGSGVAHTYQLSGPGETVYYKACRGTAVTIYYNLYVEWSADNQNWTECQNNTSLDPDYRDDFFSCPIPENARYIRFRFPGGGTLVKYIKDVRVTRKTYIGASANTTAFGDTYTDQTKTATFTVNYSSVNGGNINVSSSNPHFVPSISAISVPTNKTAVDNSNGNNTSYICGVDGTQTFTVTYTPDPDQLRAEEAEITIGDLFHSQKITLTATSQKYSTSIALSTNTTTATTVDGTITGAFAFSGTSTDTPSDDSDTDFYYTISHTQTSDVNNGSAVIAYDPAKNTVTGLNAGTARLTIYQKKTQKYHDTSQSFDFTVAKLPNNVGIALSQTALDVDGTATVTLTDDDSHGALSAAYSNITYTNEAQNREGGLLSFDAATATLTAMNAGAATVTVTQAETYKYEAASAQFAVEVSKLAQTLTWDAPDLETTIQVGATVTANTATSSAGLAVGYSSGNTAAITVDAATGALTAVSTGSNITITASQAGNYKYLPATLTRLFSVFNKQTPTFTPDAHFTGTSARIEYDGTAAIAVTGVDADNGFTITVGNGDIIDIAFDADVVTITAKALGTTTLTLAQDGNDDYLAKSQTYTIEVYQPDDMLLLSPADASTIVAGAYNKILLNRNLRAGYSTISLPFGTDVEELTSRSSSGDWVAQLSAVTYNSRDGYTLYFDKVTSGTINANQPYVLHLSADVEQPKWTGTYTVEEAAAQSVAATTGYSDGHGPAGSYSDWQMTSNFTAGFDMEGKWGIVNSGSNSAGGQGGLRLGGSGSTLNAFTAYITPPAGSNNVKTRAAFTDESGEVTLIEGVAFDGTIIVGEGDGAVSTARYTLDGRRVTSSHRGIVIERRADGTTRKVLR